MNDAEFFDELEKRVQEEPGRFVWLKQDEYHRLLEPHVQRVSA